MALKAGTAYVDVGAKVSSSFGRDVEAGITAPMDSAGKKAGGVLGGSFNKAAAVAAGGVIAMKGAEFLTGAVDAARESAKIAAQSEAVVKSTGGAANISADQMGDLAEAISKKTAVDDEAIQSAENLLATFTNVRNEAGKGNDVFNQATSTLVDMAAALGTDVSSGAIQLGKALNDPVKGITALTRVGVTFTDQQKAQIAAMVEAGDVAGAQKVILAELNKEFGGSAEAQATGADRLAVAWGNVQEQIGGKLLPVVETLSTWLADHSELILPLVGLIAGGLVVAFTAWAISAASAAAATIAAAAPVLAIIAVIALLAAGIYLLVTNWDEIWSKIVSIAAAAWDAIKGAFSAAWQWIQSTWDAGLEAIKGAWNTAWGAVKSTVSGAWETMKSTVSGGVSAVVGFIASIPSKVLGFIGDMASAAARLGGAFLDGIKSGFTAAAGFAGDIASGIVSVLKDAWNTVAGMINDLVPNELGWGPFKLDLPDNPIPTFDAGGIVGGPRGRPVMALVHGGETILPTHRGDFSSASFLDALGDAGSRGGGPAVAIENATFAADVDVDLLFARASFAAKAGRFG